MTADRSGRIADNMGTPSTNRLAAFLLLLTAGTGVVDAVSYLALGHVFTANMTGNVVLMAFAVGGTPGLSIPRSATALVAFFIGAVIGGRIGVRMSTQPSHRWTIVSLAAEAILLFM